MRPWLCSSGPDCFHSDYSDASDTESPNAASTEPDCRQAWLFQLEPPPLHLAAALSEHLTAANTAPAKLQLQEQPPRLRRIDSGLRRSTGGMLTAVDADSFLYFLHRSADCTCTFCHRSLTCACIMADHKLHLHDG